ncbi:hypothetical protein SMICM304S_02084 [Streptomyces microflavus]
MTEYAGLTNMLINHQRRIFEPVLAEHGHRTFRIAHTVSFAFDMSWEELLWLADGHEVHICDEELRRDAPLVVEYCAEHKVDVINVTPTYAQQLIAEGLLDNPQQRPPLVLLGGEAVTPALWQRLAATEGTVGYNLYGPTEYTINTLGVGTFECLDPVVGVAIDNTEVYVLDPELLTAARRCRRAVRGGHRHRPRLPGPERPDRTPLRRLPLRCPRRTHVPHRYWRSAVPTGTSATWAAPTSRSRSAATGSNSARWKPSSPPTRPYGSPPRSPSPTRRSTGITAEDTHRNLLAGDEAYCLAVAR